MGAARVQSGVATGSATSVTASLTTGSVDNIVVALVYGASGTGFSEATGATLVASEVQNSNRTLMVYKKQATAGVDSITIERATATRISIHITEASGATLADLTSSLVEFDPDSGFGDAATSVSCGPLDPASTGDVLFLALASQNASNGGANAFDNSFTKRHEDGVARSFSGDRVITDPGSTSTLASWTTAQQPGGILVAIPSSAVAAAAPPLTHPARRLLHLLGR